MAQDNTPLNPVQIEAELMNASNSVAKSISQFQMLTTSGSKRNSTLSASMRLLTLTLPARLKIVSRLPPATRCPLRKKKSSRRRSTDGWQTFSGHTVIRLPFIKH